jgi:hypothetical protein
MSGILVIAKDQLINEQFMMLQKFFHILDANLEKYLTNFDSIYEEFRSFVFALRQNTSVETYIYISDMLKQLLLKIIKLTDAKDEVIVKHIQIFRIILKKNEGNR